MSEPLNIKIRKMVLLFGLSLFFIFLRVWYLSVINYEKMQKLSELPRRRTQLVLPTRGLISDRNGHLLACNEQQFNVSILYQEIKEIPSSEIVWEEGKKIKRPKRKVYIENLCTMLEPFLEMKKEVIEDFIYAKSALFQDTPLILKENISLKNYSILKLKEKDWPGLKVAVSHKRIYPHQKVACHVIGYLGAIDDKTYRDLLEEQRVLKTYIEERERGLTPPLPKGFSDPIEVRARYDLLIEKGYRIQDYVGKEGIEKTFDVPLRGGAGKTRYEITRTGQLLTKLPGSYEKQKPTSIDLAIDLDLQEKAENLLAARENTDDLFPKGGAIVVIDLSTSQVLTLASYPRFNPQDFNEKNNDAIHQWTESETHLEHLYNGIRPVEKEVYQPRIGLCLKKQRLTYPLFLRRLLSPKSSALKFIENIASMQEVYHLLTALDPIITDPTFESKSLPEKIGQLEETEKSHLLIDLFRKTEDPILCLDLLRLLIDPSKLPNGAASLLSHFSIPEFFALSQELAQAQTQLKKALKAPFEDEIFETWRKDHFKEFLKSKRLEEAKKHTYARPYTDYLEAEKKRQYQEFIDHSEKYFIAYLVGKIQELKPEWLSFEKTLEPLKGSSCITALKEATTNLDLSETALFLKTFRPFSELNRPLLGFYPRLLEKSKHEEKHLAYAFYPKYKLGYLRSNAYRLLAPQGSVFKVAVGYEALREKVLYSKPLPHIVDSLQEAMKHQKEQILGFDETKNPIRRWHKGGLLPRSSHAGIGKVDLVSALEQSSNIYFSLLAAEYLQDPSLLIQAAKNFGLSSKTGIDLPYEPSGKLPSDLGYNKTGLYAFAIGQHELLVTPLQTAMMIGSLFQDGHVYKPLLVQKVHEPSKTYPDLFDHLPPSSIQSSLSNLGCYFPLFTEELKLQAVVQEKITEPKVNTSYFLNDAILSPIKQGLDQVVWGKKGTARPQALASLMTQDQMHTHLSLAHQLIGKTGTAEQRVIETLDKEADSRMLNHIWFSGVSFKNAAQTEPELAFCVYLKDGKMGGREAAAIAAKLLEAWRAKNQANN